MISATLYPPFRPHAIEPADPGKQRHFIRDMNFNADRHAPTRVAESSSFRSALERKQGLLSSKGDTRDERMGRFLAVRGCNAELAGHILPLIREEEARLIEMRRQIEDNRVLLNREYAFFLHPEDRLRRLADEMARQLLG